jgi:magnesium-transporting ATPase (P-type)
MNWYQQSPTEILEKLKTSLEGLADEEAKKRLGQYGPNALPEKSRISPLGIFFRQFKSPLIYILLAAATVSLFLENFVDAAVILVVVIFNAIIGTTQEFKAEESLRALRRMVVPRAKVIRGGVEREIRTEEIVPGDLVLLSSGSRVPADLRLLQSIELLIDESMLTGESVPAEKKPTPITEEGLSPAEQKNMAFMGTIVVSGRGRGVVVATGMQTALGAIVHEVGEAETVQAPLQQKFHRFSRNIGLLVLGVSALLFLLGVLVGETIRGMFMTSVAAAVATVPEGLPATLTIALAVGVRRMARRNAIIRKLVAVETLGSTTVIATDKTGTLTQNEMTVKVIFDGEHVFETTGSGYNPEGEIVHEWVPITETERKNLFIGLRIGLLCNESRLVEEDGEFRVDGDPTEGALIVSAMKAGLNPEEEKKRYPQIGIVPFESERGYMATLHQEGNRKWIFIKGGLDRVLDLCSSCSAKPTFHHEEIYRTAERFAKEGMRVLAMAYREAPPDLQELHPRDVEGGDLTLACIQGMIDPPRPEAIAAVNGCKRAGIRVVMVTGDHATTALAIAKQIGIAHQESDLLVGKNIESMSDEELTQLVQKATVYARVTPLHKLRVVQALRRRGEVVAVTGDGVNDAPALKAAHIGVAMGKKGTDVAKEAADMVIADDNFATIFSAVEEGRVVFDNIRKVTFFLMPTGIAAIGSILLTVLLGYPIPYTPSQLLWINLVTNGLQVIALTFEPGEKGVLLRPPRDPQEGVMSRLLIERTLLVGILISAGVVFNFIQALECGECLEEARTMAMSTMVFFQFFQTLNSRSEWQSLFRMSPWGNPFLLYALLSSTLAQLGSIYIPALQWIFQTHPLSLSEWANVGWMSLTVIGVVEVDKWLRRKRSMKGKSAVPREKS